MITHNTFQFINLKEPKKKKHEFRWQNMILRSITEPMTSWYIAGYACDNREPWEKRVYGAKLKRIKGPNRSPEPGESLAFGGFFKPKPKKTKP